MRVLYRQGDPRYPFLWEHDRQPPARWHAAGDGPVQYLADTPVGAWAEFVRHEEITDAGELEATRRRLWCVEVDLDAEAFGEPDVARGTLQGGEASYPACQRAAQAVQGNGGTALRAPSAALVDGGASGQVVSDGLHPEPTLRDGWVYALFGERPQAVGWAAVGAGAPPAEVLHRSRPLR